MARKVPGNGSLVSEGLPNGSSPGGHGLTPVIYATIWITIWFELRTRAQYRNFNRYDVCILSHFTQPRLKLLDKFEMAKSGGFLLVMLSANNFAIDSRCAFILASGHYAQRKLKQLSI